MVGAAKLEDLDGPPADLVLQAVAEDDHVVGDELLDAVARDRPVVLGPLGGDDRGDAHPAQGAGDPEQLAADRGVVVELGEDPAERVERDAAGLDLADGVLDPGQERAQVVDRRR